MSSVTRNFHVSGVHFKLYLSNCTTDRFEIPSVARSKVAIMIPGFYLIFLKNRMCWVFTQQVTDVNIM